MASSTVYSTPGTYTFTLPANIDVTTPITVDLSGGGGGSGDQSATGHLRGAGGAGGRVVGLLDISAMTPGVSVVTVVVGGGGQTTPATYTGSEVKAAGGYNGGADMIYDVGSNGGAGGGATDIRTGGTGLANRKAVAAGGGGGGGCGGSNRGGNGGAGGTATGATGEDTGTHGAGGGGGGTAAAGGAAGVAIGGSSNGVAGTSGNGGKGAVATGGGSGYASSGGSGGGGYFGGGGGGGAFSASDSLTNGGGGGGGSNYVAGLASSTVNTQGGGAGTSANGSATLSYNLVPNQPSLVAHANGDDTAGVQVGWVPSDPDAGDAQSKADVRWRVGAGAWTTISPAVTGAGQAYTFAANTFQTAGFIGQSVEWQVRTYDTANAVGPWSTSQFTVPRREPTTTPTITVPAVAGPTVPVTVANTTQFRYARVTMTDVTAGTTVDFGWVDAGSEVTSWAFTLATYAYVHTQQYKFRAYTADYIDVPVPSPVSTPDVTVTASINAPLTPVVTVTPDPTTASITISVVNPGSDPHPAVSNEIWRTDLDHGAPEARIATGVAPGGTFTDWQPPTNTNLRYRAAAVAAGGNKTFST